MIYAQLFLAWIAIVLFMFVATNVVMPRKWRIAAYIVVAIHVAPLLFTVWRTALLGGVVD